MQVSLCLILFRYVVILVFPWCWWKRNSTETREEEKNPLPPYSSSTPHEVFLEVLIRDELLKGFCPHSFDPFPFDLRSRPSLLLFLCGMKREEKLLPSPMDTPDPQSCGIPYFKDISFFLHGKSRSKNNCKIVLSFPCVDEPPPVPLENNRWSCVDMCFAFP